MKEGFWGVFIILLGAVGIVAINLFQNLTVTTDHNYYLMKEATKAAMEDSLDLSYYRSQSSNHVPRPRIVEQAFVENLTRRFASSAVLNKEYTVIIHDIVEQPPKVSLSVVSKAKDLKGEKYDVLLTIDAIYEGIYGENATFDTTGWTDEDIITTPDPNQEPPPTYPDDGKCPGFNEVHLECISGDLQFVEWGPADFSLDCDSNTNNIHSIERDAFYKKCECGKWSDKLKKTIDSSYKVNKDIVTHTWRFVERGPVNDIDVSTSLSRKIPDCVEGLEILVVDDTPGTNSGGTICPPEGINILSIQKTNLYPRYNPLKSENRKLKWESSKTNIASVVGQSVEPKYPYKDWATVTGKGIEGVSTIRATTTRTTRTKTAECDIYTTTCKDIVAEIGKTTKVQFKKEPIFDLTDLTYGVDDETIALINNKGEITPLKTGITSYYVTSPVSSTFSDPKTTPIKCNLEVRDKPKTVVRCPENKLNLGKNDSLTAYLVDQENNNLTGSSLATWSLTQTNVEASISDEGVLSSKETPYTTLYYKADLKEGYISTTGESSLTCPFSISTNSGNSGCPVGEIYATWNINPLPDLCASDISSKNRALVDAIGGSLIPKFCGFEGYNGNCNNGILTTARSQKIYGSMVISPTDPSVVSPGIGITTSIDSAKGTYSLIFSATFRYALWNQESLQCPLIRNTYTKTVKAIRTGRLKTTGCSSEPVKDTLNVSPEGNSEIFVGTSGIEFRAYATFSDPRQSEADIGWEAISNNLPALNKTGKGARFTYSLPSNIQIPSNLQNTDLEVALTVIHPNGVLKVERTIKVIPKVSCENYVIYQNEPTCVGSIGNYEVYYESSIAHNLNATWSSGSPLVSLSGFNPSLKTWVSGKKSGTFDLKIITQVGNCEKTEYFKVLNGKYDCIDLYPYSLHESEGSPWCYDVYAVKKPICPDYYSYDGSKCVQYFCPHPRVRGKDGLCHDTSNVTTDKCEEGFIPDSGYCIKQRNIECLEYTDWSEPKNSYVKNCYESSSDYKIVDCPPNAIYTGNDYRYTARFECNGASWNQNGYQSTYGAAKSACDKLQPNSNVSLCRGPLTKTCTYTKKQSTSTRSCKTYKENCLDSEFTIDNEDGRICEIKVPQGNYYVCKENPNHVYDSDLKKCISKSGETGMFTGISLPACPSGSYPYPESNPNSCRDRIGANAKCTG